MKKDEMKSKLDSLIKKVDDLNKEMEETWKFLEGQWLQDEDNDTLHEMYSYVMEAQIVYEGTLSDLRDARKMANLL